VDILGRHNCCRHRNDVCAELARTKPIRLVTAEPWRRDFLATLIAQGLAASFLASR
jgi:hypothetical protein